MLPPPPGSQADPADEIWRLIDADARALALVDETARTHT